MRESIFLNTEKKYIGSKRCKSNNQLDTNGQPKIQLDGSGVVAIAAATLAGADDADTVVYDANQMFVDVSGLPPRRAACCLTVELACLSCESDSLQSAKSSSLQSRIKCKKM